MKLLHTSDWHLGARLRGVDRTGDQLARVREVLAYTREREVHLLLVAGDVVDEHRASHLDGVLGELAEVLRPELERGLRAVFVAGNHDRDHLFPLLNGVQRLVGAEAAGQVVFCDQPSVRRVVAANGEALQLLLLPYPTQDRYGLQALDVADGAERRRQLADAVRRSIRELSEEVRGSADPTVVAGHFLVRGFGRDGHELSEADDVPLESADLPAFAYVALGHIHQALHLGVPSVRYSGSIERMDFGEAGDEKSAVLVEVGPRGLVGEPELLPLRATRLVRIEAAAGEPLEARAREAGDLDGAIVALRLRVERGQSTLAAQLEARRLFSRLCQPIDLDVTAPAAGGAETRTAYDRRDVAGTVRRFLAAELDGDPDRDDLLALAERLLEPRR
ncbi:MAG TPA: exonuclease subunit SbcD [Candidatus Dormibacteraeota bacterium]